MVVCQSESDVLAHNLQLVSSGAMGLRVKVKEAFDERRSVKGSMVQGSRQDKDAPEEESRLCPTFDLMGPLAKTRFPSSSMARARTLVLTGR